MRRLPIYLVVDCSESMVGPPHQSVEQGIRTLAQQLRSNPYAIETVWLSMIVFGRGAQVLVPLCEALEFQSPSLPITPGTDLGAALRELSQQIVKNAPSTSAGRQGDWKPIVLLMTDGVPTDDWQSALSDFRKNARNRVDVYAIACGDDVDTGVLHSITDSVLMMRNISPKDFDILFRWISASIDQVSQGIGDASTGIDLEKLPAGLERNRAPQTVDVASQVVLAVRCSQQPSHGYLVRCRRDDRQRDVFALEGAYEVGSDYFGEASAVAAGRELSASNLSGEPTCPYCGNRNWSAGANVLSCGSSGPTGMPDTDVLFVLDVTQSMAGEISGVKNGIHEFVKSLIHEERADVRVGLIAFRDVGLARYGKQPQPPAVLQFSGQTMTSDLNSFQQEVAKLKATGGGGNTEESSLHALWLGAQQSLSMTATKVFVLITDQIPYTRDGEEENITPEVVVDVLRKMEIDQIHMVLPQKDRIRNPYRFLHQQFDGEVFNLDEARTVGFLGILQSIATDIRIRATRG